MTRPLKVERAASPAHARAARSRRRRRERAAAVPLAAAEPVLHDGDFDVGLAALCRGAGIDPRTITAGGARRRAAARRPAAARSRARPHGHAVRAATNSATASGLGAADATSAGPPEFRRRGRRGAAAPADHHIDPRRLGGVRCARISASSRRRTRADVAAMQAAFEEFLARFDPKALEERFEQAAKRGVFGAPQQGQVLGPVHRTVRGPRAASGRRLPASVRRDLRQGLRGQAARTDSAAAQQLRRRSGRTNADVDSSGRH